MGITESLAPRSFAARIVNFIAEHISRNERRRYQEAEFLAPQVVHPIVLELKLAVRDARSFFSFT